MKPNEETRICDKCKTRVATHSCIACEEDICDDCAKLLTLELATRNKNSVPRRSAISSPYSLSFDKKSLGEVKYGICKKCETGLKDKDAIKVIEESEEMKKLIERVKQTVLKSRMANNLDESKVEDEIDVDYYVGEPHKYTMPDLWPKRKKGFFSSWMK